MTEYLSSRVHDQLGGTAVIPDDAERFRGTEEAALRRVTMIDDEGHELSSLKLGQRFRLGLHFEARAQIGDGVVEIGLSTPDGQRVATLQSMDRPGAPLTLAPGLNEVEAEVGVKLLPGEYIIDVGLHHTNGVTMDFVNGGFRFTALNQPVEGEASWPWSEVRGYVRPDSNWSPARPVADELVDAASG